MASGTSSSVALTSPTKLFCHVKTKAVSNLSMETWTKWLVSLVSKVGACQQFMGYVYQCFPRRKATTSHQVLTNRTPVCIPMLSMAFISNHFHPRVCKATYTQQYSSSQSIRILKRHICSVRTFRWSVFQRTKQLSRSDMDVLRAPG